MIKIETVDKPFIRYVAKVIPLAFDESMSYYECLCSFYNYLKNEVMPVINNNAEATAELQTLMTELKEYVDNYFDNLDVQAEVNAKLDEMVEDGTMEELIAQYLQLSTIYTYNNVAELKEAENLVNGMFVRTLGYSSYNGGGGAYYKVRNVTTSDVVDDRFIIELANDEVIAELIIDSELKISQLGIGENATTNTTIMQSALSYINDHKTIKLIIDKEFSVNNIDFTDINHITIEGNNKQVGINIIGVDNLGINLNTNLNTFINLNINTSNAITLINNTGSYNHFINCRLIGNEEATGVIMNKWSNIFDDCEIREFNKCVELDDQANFTVFNNCVLIANDNSSSYTLHITGGDDIVINSCEIEKGVNNIYVNGGQCQFMNNYIEGATGSYAIILNDGNTIFNNNYFSNTEIGKYQNNKLTLTNNIVRKTSASGYLLRCLSENIGYLVIENNVFKDENGNIINVNYGNRADAVPRYWNGSAFANGTINDYVYINQDRCFTVEPTGSHYVYIRKNNIVKGGTTSIRPVITDTLEAGTTYGDRNVNKLLFYNAYQQKWVDFMGNKPVEKRTSAPSSSTWTQGDIVWNSQPTANGVIGWVCVSSGTPGTWKSFGNIAS